MPFISQLIIQFLTVRIYDSAFQVDLFGLGNRDPR